MPSVDIIDLNNKVVGSIELSDAVFGAPINEALLYEAVRHHLAGTLGAAILTRFAELKWATRDAAPGSRVVNFTRHGEKRFAALFGESE